MERFIVLDRMTSFNAVMLPRKGSDPFNEGQFVTFARTEGVHRSP